MSLLDLGSINRFAAERNVHAHPLAESLQLAEKNGYINALAFAVFDAANNPVDAGVAKLRKVAIALGLSAADAEDAIKNIQGLRESGERNQFLIESIDSLVSREASLYYLCDFIRMCVESEESGELLSALYGLFKNRISDADVAFIADYKSYIRSGNVQGVSRMSQEHASANYNVDHSILDYFTPGWNDEFVKLPIRPQVRICDGKFMISRAFQIMDENDAVIRNAEIRFERGGYLYIIRDKPSEIQIENCIFVASERSKTSRHDTADPFVSSGTYPKVRFKNCIFSGAEAMWAIHSSSAVIFEDCEFKNMGIRGKGDICSPMITANSLVCKNCVFENCASANEVLFEAVDYVLEGCKFSRCHTNNSIFAWNGGAHKFEIRETLFEDCSTTWPIVKSFNSYKLAQDYGFYECKFDRFSHNGWCNKEEVDSKMHKGCTEIS